MGLACQAFSEFRLEDGLPISTANKTGCGSGDVFQRDS